MGLFGTRIFLFHGRIGMGTFIFWHMDILAKYIHLLKCLGAKVSCAEMSMSHKIPSAKTVLYQNVHKCQNVCAKMSILLCKVPKYPCAEMFRCRNIPVPKCSGAENSSCRKFPVPKIPHAETFRCWNVHLPERPQCRTVHVPKCSRDETSVPKWLLPKCSMPKWSIGDHRFRTTDYGHPMKA